MSRLQSSLQSDQGMDLDAILAAREQQIDHSMLDQPEAYMDAPLDSSSEEAQGTFYAIKEQTGSIDPHLPMLVPFPDLSVEGDILAYARQSVPLPSATVVPTDYLPHPNLQTQAQLLQLYHHTPLAQGQLTKNVQVSGSGYPGPQRPVLHQQFNTYEPFEAGSTAMTQVRTPIDADPTFDMFDPAFDLSANAHNPGIMPDHNMLNSVPLYDDIIIQRHQGAQSVWLPQESYSAAPNPTWIENSRLKPITYNNAWNSTNSGDLHTAQQCHFVQSEFPEPMQSHKSFYDNSLPFPEGHSHGVSSGLPGHPTHSDISLQTFGSLDMMHIDDMPAEISMLRSPWSTAAGSAALILPYRDIHQSDTGDLQSDLPNSLPTPVNTGSSLLAPRTEEAMNAMIVPRSLSRGRISKSQGKQMPRASSVKSEHAAPLGKSAKAFELSIVLESPGTEQSRKGQRPSTRVVWRKKRAGTACFACAKLQQACDTVNNEPCTRCQRFLKRFAHLVPLPRFTCDVRTKFASLPIFRSPPQIELPSKRCNDDTKKVVRELITPFLPVLNVLEPHYARGLILQEQWDYFWLYSLLQKVARWKRALTHIFPLHVNDLNTLEAYHRVFLKLLSRVVDIMEHKDDVELAVITLYEDIYSLKVLDGVDLGAVDHFKCALQHRAMFWYHRGFPITTPSKDGQPVKDAGNSERQNSRREQILCFSWRAHSLLPQGYSHIGGYMRFFNISDSYTNCPTQNTPRRNSPDCEESSSGHEEKPGCFCTVVTGCLPLELFGALNVHLPASMYSKAVHDTMNPAMLEVCNQCISIGHVEFGNELNSVLTNLYRHAVTKTVQIYLDTVQHFVEDSQAEDTPNHPSFMGAPQLQSGQRLAFLLIMASLDIFHNLASAVVMDEHPIVGISEVSQFLESWHAETTSVDSRLVDFIRAVLERGSLFGQ